MLLHPNPRRVFIGGGGEGGTLREVLAHHTVEQVVMLDLDRQVVDLCRKYLPLHNQGSFDDARATVLHQDAREYLAASGPAFDVMIMDLVDPLEGGPARKLYTEEFYEIARARMKPGGLLVTQSGPSGLLSFQECFTTIFKTLSEVFEYAMPLQAHVPAFQTLWGFSVASDAPFAVSTEAQINELISQRISKELGFYDGETHRNMVSLPKFLRAGIQEERRVNRDANPVFMV